MNIYTGHTAKHTTLEAKEHCKLHHFPGVVGTCLLQILSPPKKPKNHKQQQQQQTPKPFFYIKKVNRRLQKLILKEHILLFLKRIGNNKHHLIILGTLLNALQESTQTMTAEDNMVCI